MEYVKGIIIMQINAGIDSVKSSKGILTIGSSINRPTIISAGAVAAGRELPPDVGYKQEDSSLL